MAVYFRESGYRTDLRPSLMGKVLDRYSRRQLSGADLVRHLNTPGNLTGVSQDEARVLLSTLMGRPSTHATREAIRNVLASLSPQDRGNVLRQIDGSANRTRVDALVRGFEESSFGPDVRWLVMEGWAHAPKQVRVVISDIDDTIFNHGDIPYFPGASEFMRALTGPGDLHLATARELAYAAQTGTDVQKTQVEYSSTAFADRDLSLEGNEKDQSIEDSKVEEIQMFLERNPYADFVLIGDDTQRDPRVFDRILSEYGARIEAVLVHRVSDHPAAIPQDLKRSGKLLPYQGYGDAAGQAKERNMIGPEQCDQVWKYSS